MLQQREASIAQCVLVEIARNTTFEFPWLTERRILDAENLEKLCSRRELTEALKALTDELIVDKETLSREPKYRIRIPIVASAIKQDANELESIALAGLDS